MVKIREKPLDLIYYSMFSKTYLFHFFSILLIFVSSVIYSQEYSEKNTKNVANSILNNFNSCVFTTLDSNNNPVSRLMDPYIYNNNFEIYLVTNPKSRKVSHLINNDRISLTFISKDSNSYVSINGSAVLINELSQKQKYWKSSWTPYYKDLDNDCILIKINIKSLEIVSSLNDVSSNPVTWEPTTIIF